MKTNTVADFKVGQRVELHPGTDRWMMGDRLGVVSRMSASHVWVKLDVSRKTLPFNPENILTKNNDESSP